MGADMSILQCLHAFRGRTLSTLCERKMFWRILKLAMNSYSCFAFIFTLVIGTSPTHIANPLC